ncbi:hypothetical protein HDU93_006333, partial [Gonapodya sp. JEL0774]
MISGAFSPDLKGQLEFTWDRNMCDLVGSAADHASRKDLGKVWKSTTWKPKNTLIIDDTSSKSVSNPHNAILIPSYDVLDCAEGEPERDTQLVRIARYLKDLKSWFEKAVVDGETADVRTFIADNLLDTYAPSDILPTPTGTHLHPIFSITTPPTPNTPFLHKAVSTNNEGVVIGSNWLPGWGPQSHGEGKNEAKRERRKLRKERKKLMMQTESGNVSAQGTIDGGEKNDEAQGLGSTSKVKKSRKKKKSEQAGDAKNVPVSSTEGGTPDDAAADSSTIVSVASVPVLGSPASHGQASLTAKQ